MPTYTHKCFLKAYKDKYCRVIRGNYCGFQFNSRFRVFILMDRDTMEEREVLLTRAALRALKTPEVIEKKEEAPDATIG